jgi:uncharacterized protein (DUF302 family)
VTTRNVTIERITVTSLKPFEAVISALEAAVGRANMPEYVQRTEGARTLKEMESAVEKAIGPSGFMMFLKLDLGAVLRKETGLDSPKIVRFLIGNPLIMREMARHVPDAGSYAPVTILVDERPDGVHLSYDRMASFLAPYGSAEALVVARDLDKKVENLLQNAAATASA